MSETGLPAGSACVVGAIAFSLRLGHGLLCCNVQFYSSAEGFARRR
jgi:hypothetical protein